MERIRLVRYVYLVFLQSYEIAEENISEFVWFVGSPKTARDVEIA